MAVGADTRNQHMEVAQTYFGTGNLILHIIPADS